MKALAAAAVAVCLGCPDQREFVLTDDEIRNGFYFDVRQTPGEWRYEIWAFNKHVGTHRYFFSGPGGIFWLIRYPGELEPGLEPVDCSQTYESWGSRFNNTIVYVPPGDDAPPGARAAFACEVLSPVSGRWIRSQDWLLPAARAGEFSEKDRGPAEKHSGTEAPSEN